jgi:hypothetical protein
MTCSSFRIQIQFKVLRPVSSLKKSVKAAVQHLVGIDVTVSPNDHLIRYQVISDCL